MLIPRPATELIVEAMLRAVSRPGRAAGGGRRLHRLRLRGGGDRARAPGGHRRRHRHLDARRSRWRGATPSRHGVDDRVTFRHGDLLDGIDGSSTRSSPTRRTSSTAPGRRSSRRCATTSRRSRCLAASEGFDLVTRLVAEAPSRLRPGGYLVFEFGLGQDVEVEELIARTPELSSWNCGAICRASRGPRSRGGARADRTQLRSRPQLAEVGP